MIYLIPIIIPSSNHSLIFNFIVNTNCSRYTHRSDNSTSEWVVAGAYRSGDKRVGRAGSHTDFSAFRRAVAGVVPGKGR